MTSGEVEATRWRPLFLARSCGQATLSSAASATVLVLTLVSGVLTYGPASAGPTAETSAQELYVSAGESSAECEGPPALVQIDAITLGDLANGKQLEMCGEASRSWAFSADGSTVVTIEYVHRGSSGEWPNFHETISVSDGRTGQLRTRFAPSAHVFDLRLSRDGSRLVVEVVESDVGASGPPTWYVFDTEDGRLLSTTRAEEPHGWESWIDPEARRLYRLLPSSQANRVPVPMVLIAYDLTAGTEAARRELAAVLGGNYLVVEDEHQFGQLPPYGLFRPGLAVSSDGRSLAIVHADAEAVTLIDAERLTVERTVTLARSVSLLDRLIGLLPLVPSEAEAKGPGPGTTRQAMFAPDGHRLYVWGFTVAVDQKGEMTFHGLGIQLVDLDRGTIVADGLPDEELNTAMLAPDGESLYTFGPDEPAGGWHGSPDHHTVVRRVDADSLDTLSERAFDGWRMILLKPLAAE